MGKYEFARFTMAWLSQAKRISKELIVFCIDGSAIEKLCGMLYPRVRKMIWHKPLGSQYAGSHERKLWYSFETILHCHDQETWEVVKPKNLKVANLIKDARTAKGLSRGAVDMVIRGKKTGLCYRWEEAACIPTPEQTKKLKPLLGLGDDFGAALKRAYSDRDDTLEKAAEKAAEKADVFIHRTVNSGRHPCEKPEALLMDMLSYIDNDYSTILDPFMGSGTTGVACKRLGRDFIGIELDPKYFEIAKKRIADG